MDAAERFSVTIDDAARGGAVVEVPSGVVEALGGAGRIPVNATFDGIDLPGFCGADGLPLRSWGR